MTANVAGKPLARRSRTKAPAAAAKPEKPRSASSRSAAPVADGDDDDQFEDMITRDSYSRRGESMLMLSRRLKAAERHFELWTGSKLRIDYGQVQAAVSLFSLDRSVAAQSPQIASQQV